MVVGHQFNIILMKKNVLIAGFGSIGKRHFEGLLKSNFDINLYIIEPFLTKRDFSKLTKKYLNINSIRTFSYIINFKVEFDLAIISTNSNIRSKILRKIISKNYVKNLILEKILFQKYTDYNEILRLLKNKKINTWVNCPRRIYEFYKFVKKNILANEKIIMDVSGSNWGICCNSIHFIDLLDFFKKFESYKISKNNLDKKIYNSKRKNFFEFKGNFSLITNKGDILNIYDEKSKNDQKIILIYNKKKYIIDETKKTVIIIHNKRKKLKKFSQSIYQSDLTNIQIDEIFNNQKSSLTNYKTSMKHHLPLINFFLNHFNINSNSKRILCPIT